MRHQPVRAVRRAAHNAPFGCGSAVWSPHCQGDGYMLSSSYESTVIEEPRQMLKRISNIHLPLASFFRRELGIRMDAF